MYILSKLKLTSAALSIALATLATSQASAQTANASCGAGLPLSGTFTFNGQTASYVVGARWGKGVLTLNDGTQLPFIAQGFRAFELGASVATMEGEVYGLTEPTDFIGHYNNIPGGIVAVKSETEIGMINGACVAIVARINKAGAKLNLPANLAIKIQFADD